MENMNISSILEYIEKSEDRDQALAVVEALYPEAIIVEHNGKLILGGFIRPPKTKK